MVDAVAYLHVQNVVHCDIKPENVLMSGQSPVLVDFGVAQWPQRRMVSGYGSLGYMPPEARGDERGEGDQRGSEGIRGDQWGRLAPLRLSAKS